LANTSTVFQLCQFAAWRLQVAPEGSSVSLGDLLEHLNFEGLIADNLL
jgi:hypothetical protein